MQIAFGRVRPKTEPTGPGVKIRLKNGQLNDPALMREVNNMLRDLLSRRWFQGGFAFFVLCVCGSLLYSWHVQRSTEVELERSNRLSRGTEQQKTTRPPETAIVENTNETPGLVNTPDENTDTPMPDATESLENETAPLDLADAFLPDDIATEEAPTEDVPVSLHGFGPYPEVPEDFPLPVDWTGRTEQQELLMRVMIKAWTDGERFIGGNIVNGKVRLNFPNTVYVRYKEIPTDDGSVISTRVIVGATDIEAPPPGENFPPGVRVLDFDEAGIDPYEYLDLP